MEGPNIRANLSILNGGNSGGGDAENQLGIIPRTIEKLFNTIREPIYGHMEFTIMVSYFEICKLLNSQLYYIFISLRLICSTLLLFCIVHSDALYCILQIVRNSEICCLQAPTT